MKTFLSTLAITLAFTFMPTPAEAGLTEGQKCAMKANLLIGKFSLCLNKADANVSKGRLSDTAAADAKCETKFRDGWDKTRTKAQEKDADNGNAEMLGADCNGAMSDAVRDSVEASALIAAGRHDMTAFAVSEADLADDSGVQELIDEAVAAVDITSDNAALCTDAGGTYYAGNEATSPVCSVDITSDNAAAERAGCEAANGTWDSSGCTPAAPDCFRLGACGSDGWNYGSYAGSTAASTGCDQTEYGSATYAKGVVDLQYSRDNNHIAAWRICDGLEAECVADPTICDDGNPCTIDSCDPGQGCVYVDETDETDGEPCDDGNACTVNDMCASGSCTNTQQLECDDQKVCTTDTCNEVSGCVYTSTCSNGQSCEQSGCVSLMSDPCGNYVNLNQQKRQDTFYSNENFLCDCDGGFPENKWFRITDTPYHYVPEFAPEKFHCGTMAPVWMNGSHPTRAQGIVTRLLCAHWAPYGACMWGGSWGINVKQCDGFFVYKVPSVMPYKYTRLCSTQTIPAALHQ